MAWTTKEAAEYLNVTRTTVTRLCKKGTLTARMHGRDWDIDPDSVKAYELAPKNKGGRPRIGKVSKEI